MAWTFSKVALLGALSGAAIAAAIAVSAGAEAKSTYESPYGYERTWNAALRLVRVDNGWKINEKDEANGYLLFDYAAPQTGKTTPGSLELVRGRDVQTSVNVLVQLPQMPHYHEQVILDSLAAKMRREYGDPPEPPPPPARREPPDGGPDADD